MAVGRLDDRQLILLVIDGEVSPEAWTDLSQRVAFAPQHAHTERVKGEHVRRRRKIGAFEQPGYSLAHFLGGFVRKSDCQDGRGWHANIVDNPRNPVGDHPRFAATGASQDQQRAFRVSNGLALGRVQSVKKIHSEFGKTGNYPSMKS